MLAQERMNIVIVGHVDHGKSTVIGRLLADTNSLPQGKLDQVRRQCEQNARPFEYAFLLDALADEQAQGITIDMARCFFKTERRHYIVLDAPGHIEFLKNMVTGAAAAEAALLVIDAKEGVQENSRRHGYLVSMLGIKKLVVLVNKMDLVDYSEAAFESTRQEYAQFLKELNVEPLAFIPIAAREGDLMVGPSDKMPWYSGLSVLQQLDAFEPEPEDVKEQLPLRFPVQDVYKFTAQGDDRRIFAGSIETGKVAVGDEVIFLPSGKESRITSIESFNASPATQAKAGEATGFTLATQVYVPPGELMCKKSEPQPQMGRRFRANLFWMGRAPLIRGKNYKLKLATRRVPVRLVEIRNVLDASDLSSVVNKQVVERHDVGECIFEALKPIAFDRAAELDGTGRFVLVDGFEIAGGGIILEASESEETLAEAHVREREAAWQRGQITPENRAAAFLHRAKFVVFSGPPGVGKRKIAVELERRLFAEGRKAYYLADSNLNEGLDRDLAAQGKDRSEEIRRLGELARIMTDSGQIFITALAGVDDYDLEQLKTLNAPNEILVVQVGADGSDKFRPDLSLAAEADPSSAVGSVLELLNQFQILEYYI
ncbi:MAG: GTP-binding protein [bacterium]|nr:GTP-binding protein [bacterium]